jgi:hypothetical protein
LVLALLGPTYLTGRTFFWGDLAYLHHPWRTLCAQIIQQGQLPLWDRYIHFGMPLAAEMQCAAWYPLTAPFYLFQFPTALGIYHSLHIALAAFFAFLWLRRLHFSRAACAGGAVLFALCGGTLSRLPFLNHLSTIAFFPALMLFPRTPVLLALALAAAFLSGYPTMLVGAAAAMAAFELFAYPSGIRLPGESGGPGTTTLLDSPVAGRNDGNTFSFRHVLKGWAFAGLLAAGLAACLLLPGMELALQSRRGGGMDPAETLLWSFSFRDLLQFLAPPIIGKGEYSAAALWWKTAYFGMSGCVLALIGFFARARGRVFAAAYAAVILLLILGNSNPLSEALWRWLPPLRYIRYPGNTAYLLIPWAAWLTARGLDRRRWAGLGCALIGAELLAYAWTSQPAVPRGYFQEAGPLVHVLRAELDGHRYLLSPKALFKTSGKGKDVQEAYSDVRHRLYGLQNAPYRLGAAANLGEPLVPKPQYALMDFLYLRSGLADLAAWLPWADIRLVLAADPQPSGGLAYIGESLWHLYRAGASSRAYWFAQGLGDALPARAGESMPACASGRPLSLLWDREDRFRVSYAADRPGWLYVSEPAAGGWKVLLDGTVVSSEQAFTAFRKARLPAGRGELVFRYAPASWTLGLMLTLSFLCALAAYWYNRVRLWKPLDRA